MKNFLMIIESDWKVYKLTQLLNEVGCTNFKVISTRGRIRDFPSNRMGVNLETYAAEEVYLDEHLIKKIRSESGKYGKTLICTDDDTEGEKIAFDLAKEIINSYQRSIIKDMTTNSVLKAIGNGRDIDMKMVNEHISKRTVNRIIGFNLSVTDIRNRSEVGRVITPVLSHIEKNAQKSGIIYKNLQSDGKNVKLIFDCFNMDRDAIKGITEQLSNITKIELIQSDENELLDSSTLWNGKQAMINIASSLNMKVIEVFKHLQDLYAEGLISYFRTDSCSVSDDDVSTLIELASEFGIVPDSRESIISRAKKGNNKLSKIERVQHSHGALIPLNPNFNPYAPLSSLSDRDKVYSLLVRHTLKAVKKPAIIKEARFKPDLSSINNKEFFNIISQYRDKVDYKFISRTIKGHDKPEFPYYPEILPNGVNLGIEKMSKDCGYRLIQKDLMVALLLVRYGLSRPSTFAYHSEKISKRYINDENTLNVHAKSSLLKASQVAPVLCDLKTYHELDNIFANNEMTLHERIALSLEIITKKDTAEGQTTEKVKSSEISPFR
ncbi:hypothetical protein B9J93_02495 [Vibrio sp. V17_P4S1T151]|uniref:DNA topoisomerase n=1 Tax=unclassified Vibrio TaxID=2614977 RepID=UPI000B8EE0C5|nr:MULTISPECIES: DNA topoisomerase [unclassified Vibrio]OXX49464.1 hypothetical protein B9J93_02495 [Vibrio sp. V17_P4S1T151]OXX64966.1 hypothetical protein B9J89_03555 [Vibrio sp. V15_P4S5T153]